MKKKDVILTEGEIIEKWMPQVHQLLNRSNIQGIEREDQEANMMEQVLVAWRAYDETRGASFHTYLYACLMNRIRQMIGEAQKRKTEFTFGEAGLNKDDQNSRERLVGDLEDGLGHLANGAGYQWLSGEYRSLDFEIIEDYFGKISLTVQETKVAILQALGFTTTEINKIIPGASYQNLRSKTRDFRNNFSRRSGCKTSQYQKDALKILKDSLDIGDESVEQVLTGLGISIPETVKINLIK